MRLTILYFAWLRERIDLAREEVETSAGTVEELVAELRARGPRYQAAFTDVTTVRVAIDQELVDFDAKLDQAREVAFFPPMTGG